jgi:hypothetical protein
MFQYETYSNVERFVNDTVYVLVQGQTQPDFLNYIALIFVRLKPFS